MHQYHVAEMVNPNVIPVQGKSPSVTGRIKCMKLEGIVSLHSDTFLPGSLLPNTDDDVDA